MNIYKNECDTCIYKDTCIVQAVGCQVVHCANKIRQGSIPYFISKKCDSSIRYYHIVTDLDDGDFLIKIIYRNTITFLKVQYTTINGIVHISYIHQTGVIDPMLKTLEINLKPNKEYYIRIEDALVHLLNTKWNWYSLIAR